jgi:hypothetical protein
MIARRVWLLQMSAALGGVSLSGLAQPQRATVAFLSAAAPDERFRSDLRSGR